LDRLGDEAARDVFGRAGIRRGENADAHTRILPAVPAALAHDLEAMAGARQYNDWLIDRARPWLHGRVLDVGAGIGTHTVQLQPLADEVVALEPEHEFAAMLRANVDGATVVEGGIDEVDGRFDAIVCFNVLEHIA